MISKDDRDDHVMRYVDAVAYGALADHIFREECLRRGLRPEQCYDAPLIWMAATERTHHQSH